MWLHDLRERRKAQTAYSHFCQEGIIIEKIVYLSIHNPLEFIKEGGGKNELNGDIC